MVSPVIDASVSFFCPICLEIYLEAGIVQPSKYTEIFGVTILIVIRFISLHAALVVLLSKRP